MSSKGKLNIRTKVIRTNKPIVTTVNIMDTTLGVCVNITEVQFKPVDIFSYKSGLMEDEETFSEKIIVKGSLNINIFPSKLSTSLKFFLIKQKHLRSEYHTKYADQHIPKYIKDEVFGLDINEEYEEFFNYDYDFRLYPYLNDLDSIASDYHPYILVLIRLMGSKSTKVLDAKTFYSTTSDNILKLLIPTNIDATLSGSFKVKGLDKGDIEIRKQIDTEIYNSLPMLNTYRNTHNPSSLELYSIYPSSYDSPWMKNRFNYSDDQYVNNNDTIGTDIYDNNKNGYISGTMIECYNKMHKTDKLDRILNYQANSKSIDNHNWERDTFNAMTDGSQGDYEDFNGNIDRLFD